MPSSNYIPEIPSEIRVSSFVRPFNLGLQKCRYLINRAIDIFDWGNSLEGKNAH